MGRIPACATRKATIVDPDHHKHRMSECLSDEERKPFAVGKSEVVEEEACNCIVMEGKQRSAEKNIDGMSKVSNTVCLFYRSITSMVFSCQKKKNGLLQDDPVKPSEFLT